MNTGLLNVRRGRRFPSSLLKGGDHGTTHQFSPALPVSAVVVHSARVLSVLSFISFPHRLRRLPLPLAPSRRHSEMYVQRFCALIMYPMYCSFRVLTVATSSLSAPMSFITDSLVLWSVQQSNWFAAHVCSMLISKAFSWSMSFALIIRDSLPYNASGHTKGKEKGKGKVSI